MVLCLFPWPLRQRLSLPVETAFYVHTEERDAYIRCATTDGANIISYTGRNYSWLTGRETGFVSELQHTSDSGEMTPLRRVYFRGETPQIDGVETLGRYTQLDVVFELDDVVILDSDERFGALQQWVEGAVQQFMNLYRTISQEHDMVQTRADELVQTYIFVADEYQLGPNGFNATFRPHKPRFHMNPLEGYRHSKRQLTQQQVDEFARFLRLGYQLPLSNRLLLDAQEQAHSVHQYDLAIILVATAFEAFLREILTETCERQGQLTLTRQTKQGPDTRDYKEAIARGDTRTDLLQYVDDLGGRSDKGGKEYGAWLRDAFEVRHRIIHRGERGFGDTDARRAFEATVAYMDQIRASLQ